VQEREDIPTAWASGPEYQLLEKSHHDHNADPKKRAGCLYGLQTRKNAAPEKPAGQWNQSRIEGPPHIAGLGERHFIPECQNQTALIAGRKNFNLQSHSTF